MANRFDLCFDLNTGFAPAVGLRKCCPTEPYVRYARFEHRSYSSGYNAARRNVLFDMDKQRRHTYTVSIPEHAGSILW